MDAKFLPPLEYTSSLGIQGKGGAGASEQMRPINGRSQTSASYDTLPLPVVTSTIFEGEGNILQRPGPMVNSDGWPAVKFWDEGAPILVE